MIKPAPNQWSGGSVLRMHQLIFDKTRARHFPTKALPSTWLYNGPCKPDEPTVFQHFSQRTDQLANAVIKSEATRPVVNSKDSSPDLATSDIKNLVRYWDFLIPLQPLPIQ